MEENNKVPVHVSIIMDGNGRWAQKRGKERFYGHIEGVESVRACTEEAVRKGVRYLSLFAFSEENWNRPEEEVHSLMELMVKAMVNELPTFLKNGIKFIVLGNRARLSDSLNRQIDDCMDRTSGCTSQKRIFLSSQKVQGLYAAPMSRVNLSLKAASIPRFGVVAAQYKALVFNAKSCDQQTLADNANTNRRKILFALPFISIRRLKISDGKGTPMKHIRLYEKQANNYENQSRSGR